MISVQFTIRCADFENIKVRIEGDNMGALLTDMQAIEMSAARLFRTYEHFVQVRDMGHQEAVEAVVQGLGAVVVEEVPAVQPEAAEDPSKPFWEARQEKIIPISDHPSAPSSKPWERKQSSPEPAAPTAGQSVNLL